MSKSLQITRPAGPGVLPAQASSDVEMIGLWLAQHRSTNTTAAYGADVTAFRAFSSKPLGKVTVGDLQAFGLSLAHLAASTQARRMSAIKSLVAFGHRLGYLPFDVGAPIRLPPIKDRLAERIMSEEQVQRLLWHTDSGERRGPLIARNAALVRLLYTAGLRISEAGGLCWRDLAARDDGGQVTVFGKGGKTRVVLLPMSMWLKLTALRGDGGADQAVFHSLEGSGRLTRQQVHHIVKAAFRRAKLPVSMSAHYLRHAHASHALDRGCPVHVLQQTLGHASLVTTTKYTHARPGDSSSRYLAT